MYLSVQFCLFFSLFGFMGRGNEDGGCHTVRYYIIASYPSISFTLMSLDTIKIVMNDGRPAFY